MRLDNPTLVDLNALANDGLDSPLTIQFSDSSAYDQGILQTVDAACETFGSRITVRFYSHYRTGFDCSSLRFIPSVQSLLLDCLDTVANLEYIEDLNELVAFGFGVFEAKSPGFLKFRNMQTIRRLVLGDTRKHDIDFAPLSKLEALENLTVVGHHKKIYVLAAKNGIETLSLRSIPKAVGLGFVSKMVGLRRLSISFGGRETIEEIQHRAIESLELGSIRGLGHVHPGAFPSLTNLEIEGQPRLTTLDVFGTPRLRRLRIINCKGLTELRGIESLGKLEEVRLGRTSLDPDELLSRRLQDQINSFHIWGYGAKRDEQIATKWLRGKPQPNTI